VSGKEYLKYGGDTSCIEIRTADDEIIIIDAGTGLRRLGNNLMAEGRYTYHFIFTHAHWDHVMGFPFFKPIFYGQTRLTIHKCPFHTDFTEKMLNKVMSPPSFPVKYSQIKAEIVYPDACPETFTIGTVTIDPIPLSHPNGGAGYKFTENGKTFVYLSDNELGFKHGGGLPPADYLAFARGADLFIHDAEYTDDEYKKTIEWGHSTYTQALDLAIQAGVKQFGLFHLNQDRSDTAMDAIVAECRQRLKREKVSMDCFAVAADDSFQL
jgi:ribonuclease BN (tRNA processing enzyme)